MLGEDLCNLCALIELASSTRFKKHVLQHTYYTIAEDADSVSGVRSRMHDFEEEEES
jgi:hypothetical protein